MNNASTTQDIERVPIHESADIEQEQGYAETQPGLGRVNEAGEINQQQPTWRPGDEAAGETHRESVEQPNAGSVGNADNIARSRAQES